MSGITEKVFSEAEVRKLGIKITGAAKADVNECVGSVEEELEVKTVTKKCRGVVAKSRTKGTGKGTLKVTAHVEQDLFANMYGMEKKNKRRSDCIRNELTAPSNVHYNGSVG